MNALLNLTPQEESAFETFVQKHSLTSEQSKQFYNYLNLLLKTRELFNLTAIDSVIDTIHYHFTDSLSLIPELLENPVHFLADVGTGGGLPGIPLKIYFPEMNVILIETNSKKVIFLQEVITHLGLKNIDVIQQDWRTFLRKTSYPVEMFIARASLHPDELLRIYKPSSNYQQSRLVYWASTKWKIQPEEQPYFDKEYSYQVANKQRRLIFFKYQ